MLPSDDADTRGCILEVRAGVVPSLELYDSISSKSSFQCKTEKVRRLQTWKHLVQDTGGDLDLWTGTGSEGLTFAAFCPILTLPNSG
jgi:hypothetical protein